MLKSDLHLDTQSAPASSLPRAMDGDHRGLWSVQIDLSGTGALHTDGVIQAWCGVRWDTVATFSIDATDHNGGLFSFEGPFSRVQTVVNTLTGSGARVQVSQNVL